MHLDTSAEGLWKEITNAVKARDSRLSSFKRQIQAYTGSYFSGSTSRGGDAAFDGESSYDPSNFGFQFIAWMLPQLVYHNPKWVVKANKTGPTEWIARSHKHGLDRWARDERLAEKLQMVATDFLQNFGVVILTCEDHPTIKQRTGKHKGKPARRPCIDRIPQDRFIRDPQATCKEEVAFMGHSWLTTKKDLLERAKDRHEEGWNVETINGMSEGVGIKDQFKNRAGNFWDIDRKQLAIYEIWVKDYEDEDHPGSDEGFYGTIFTLSLDQKGDSEEEPLELRKPRPYYGSPNGPYHVADVYPVSNEPYRLSPLIAVEGQVREWNRLTRAVNRSAASYKRLVLVNNAHEDLADILAGAEHDLVIPMPGLDKDEIVVNLEIGGITQEMLTTEVRAKELVERASGYTEAAQGQVSGNSTATEAQLVSQNSSTRTDFPLLRFHQFVAGIGEDVSRYFWYDEEIQFSLGSAALEGVELPEGAELWFQGGDHDPESGLTFEDLEFDIEPMSMRRVSEAEQQQKAQAIMAGASQLGQIAAQMPWVDVRRLAEMYGEANNIPEFADLINVDMAAQIGAQMQEAPHVEQPKLNQPGSGLVPGNQNGGKRPATPRSSQMLPQRQPTQGVM